MSGLAVSIPVIARHPRSSDPEMSGIAAMRSVRSALMTLIGGRRVQER
jgi:hypothetical protein